MNFVPCAAWIKRGVTKEIPDKITLSKEDLKRLVKGREAGDDDDSSGEDDDVENTNALRLAENDFNQYNLDNYDDEDSDYGPTIADVVAIHAEDDPHLLLRDEDDNSDDEDFHIKPDDNLVVCGEVTNDEYNLQFHVYNEASNSFYVHHDIPLDNIPLCVEWLNHSPADEAASEHANLVAVGGMSSVIQVWDVDIVDALEPVMSLDGAPKKKKKEKKTKTSSEDDTPADAVLDLAWNANLSHILASGTSKRTVDFWDLDNGCISATSEGYEEKVQSIKWHPFEPCYLLTGSTDNYVRLVDCRDTGKFAKTWKCDGEVEKVIWDHYNPFHCLASTDKGFVHCFDARSDKPLWNLSAHATECSGLALSSQCPGFLLTASLDKCVKVWDILGDVPSCVHEAKINIGRLCCLAASPDSPFVAFVGGDNKSHNMKVIDLMEFSSVAKTFVKRMNGPPPSEAEASMETSSAPKKKVKKMSKNGDSSKTKIRKKDRKPTSK